MACAWQGNTFLSFFIKLNNLHCHLMHIFIDWATNQYSCLPGCSFQTFGGTWNPWGVSLIAGTFWMVVMLQSSACVYLDHIILYLYRWEIVIISSKLLIHHMSPSETWAITELILKVKPLFIIYGIAEITSYLHILMCRWVLPKPPLFAAVPSYYYHYYRLAKFS